MSECDFKAAAETTGVVDFMRGSGHPPSLHRSDKASLSKSDKTPHDVSVSLA
jgi:hypothetical protein